MVGSNSACWVECLLTHFTERDDWPKEKLLVSQPLPQWQQKQAQWDHELTIELGILQE